MTTLKITAISDLHGYFPNDLPGGDILIIAGDCTASDRMIQWAHFFDWFTNQKYEKKVLVAGNHDNYLKNLSVDDKPEFEFDYLCDSSIKYKGLKIYGMPYSLTFPQINTHCAAFALHEDELQRKYDLIPDDVNILISHGPPYGILDKTIRGECVGSLSLLKKINPLPNLTHVFTAHIHEQGGKMIEIDGKKFYNCSIMDENYEPVNKPTHIEIEI